MGESRKHPFAAEMDAWLRDGHNVVAASERAARAVAEDYHRSRRAEGLRAWPSPAVEPWNGFLRRAWKALSSSDDRLVLNAVQEQALWAEIITGSRHGEMLLEAPLQRVAQMASDAHALLGAYAPRLLNEVARSNWQQDAGVFSGWLAEFDRKCASGRLMSPTRLPHELIAILKDDRSARQPLFLAGFDRLQPVQAMVLEAWGQWRQAESGEASARAAFYQAADEQLELAACVLWCKEKLRAAEGVRLLVVTQDLPARRGEFERMFLRFFGDGSTKPSIEFSMGVPLGQIPLVRAAHLLLRWLGGALDEHELDWLLGSGLVAVAPAETHALTGFMRALRGRGLERTRWTCDALLKQRAGVELPAAWAVRIQEARRRLNGLAKSGQSPLAWADFVPELLQAAGWPGARALTSEEFQALRRWQHVLDLSGSLGFNGQQMRWSEFLEWLGQALDETLFAPESQDAAIVIAGPAESAGLAADAIWFMGANEEAWPAPGSMHPLLPVAVQREFRMPHATAQLDWDLARTVMMRLMASAPEVCFSFAGQVGGVEMHASRLARSFAGEVQPVPAGLAAPALPLPTGETVEDYSRVRLADGHVAGGSAVLNAQSQCPFKAFATARLGAQGWGRAQAGLTAAQRGNLLHKALHSVWRQGGIRSHAELKAIADLRSFVMGHVHAALGENVPSGVRERMPRGYLALEEERLTNVVTEWLEYERTRAEFVVADTEVKKEATIAGLALDLRLDRIDRLNDGKFLVIDYKTGDVKTSVWEMPRPEDVQLPLYATFALDAIKEPLGGLVFAKVRTGKHEFAGRMWDAKATLLPDGIDKKALARDPLTQEQLNEWHGYIGKLARDFLAGQADVNPIDRQRICGRCDLQTLCRIAESAVEDEADAAGEEAGDE